MDYNPTQNSLRTGIIKINKISTTQEFITSLGGVESGEV